MSKTRLALLSFAAIAALAPAHAQRTTTWKGTLDTGPQKLRLQVDVTQTAGDLAGQLISLDQGNVKLDLAEITQSDADLSFAIPQLGATFEGRMNKDATAADGQFRQAGATFPLTLTRSADDLTATAERLREAWVGKLNMGVVEPVMQFRIMETETGEHLVYFDSVTEGRTGFGGAWTLENNTLTFEIPPIRLSFSGTLNHAGDLAEGTWSQGGRQLPLTLKRQVTEYSDQKVWENRPQRPKAPFPYESADVRFENTADQVALAGTLTIPASAGPHPAVVLLSGSGAQDRDQFIWEHRPFLVLADHLSRRGIAVLRYDDRGTAKSTGAFGTATIEDFARDASAAVDFLRTQDRIDPERIGFIGHSEGGLTGPMAANLRGDIAFLVLMGATGVDGQTILLSQSEAMSLAAGTPKSEVAVAMDINRAVMAVAANAKPGEDVAGKVMQAVDQVIATIPEPQREAAGAAIRAGIRPQVKKLLGAWMRHFLNYDPTPALSRLDMPVLAIWGTKDLQVQPSLNRPAVEAALAANPDATFVTLDGLNHMFQAAETGLMTEYPEIDETINPAALSTISDWLKTLP